MGLINPAFPDLDLESWRQGSRSERLKPMARHVAEVGFGTPDIVYVVYALKIAVYVVLGMLFALSTPGIDGFTDVGTWWSHPVVFQKAVFWTMLFEVLGLGCGFGPLNLRFTPPMGAFLYWLRPGTIRLPPWPSRVPGTRGSARAPVDVLLYAALLGSLVWTLLGVIPRTQVVTVLVLLVLIGLRDKTIFLAARAEVYGSLAVTFLFSGVDAVIGSKLVMLCIWWGAAGSKLTFHFANVIACMLSNSAVIRSSRLKRLLHKKFPDDLRPSRVAEAIAHTSTAVEFFVPLVLVVAGGGTVTTVAATVMILFHLGILLSMPQGAPLEWNVFMCFAVLSLFVHQAGVHPGDLVHPLPVLALIAVIVGTVVYGNARPDKVSFLPAMRYYAGNWDTSQWLFTESGLAKLEAHTVRAAPLPYTVLESFYGKEEMDLPIWIGYAFRSMHSHGRALLSLVPRACGPTDETDYLMVEGELVAGVVLGWNFGDGHLHNEQLLEALQERCHWEPGELRVVMLEAQPIQRQCQRYRLLDAATGELERGEVDVSDMRATQPWELVPVRVLSGPSS
ncbi:MAG: hypothetical protein JWO12_261 [Frankiales bacterium]|nr:hypothetical protein [Frankiales bacterium]